VGLHKVNLLYVLLLWIVVRPDFPLGQCGRRETCKKEQWQEQRQEQEAEGGGRGRGSRQGQTIKFSFFHQRLFNSSTIQFFKPFPFTHFLRPSQMRRRHRYKWPPRRQVNCSDAAR